MPPGEPLAGIPDLVREASPESLPALLGRLVEAEELVRQRLRSANPVEGITRVAQYRLLAMKEVAEVLSVPEEHARELGRRGALPTVQLGRYVRVRAEDLRAYIGSRRFPVDATLFATYSSGRDGEATAGDSPDPGSHSGPARGSRGNHVQLSREAGARRDRHFGAGRSARHTHGAELDPGTSSTKG